MPSLAWTWLSAIHTVVSRFYLFLPASFLIFFAFSCPGFLFRSPLQWRCVYLPSPVMSPSRSCKPAGGGCRGGARCLRCWSGYRSHQGPWLRKQRENKTMLPSLDASYRNNDFISSCQQLNGIFFFFFSEITICSLWGNSLWAGSTRSKSRSASGDSGWNLGRRWNRAREGQSGGKQFQR